MADTASFESSDTADDRECERDQLLNSETRRALHRQWHAARRVGAGLFVAVLFWLLTFAAGVLSAPPLVAGIIAVACTVVAPIVSVYVAGRAGGQSHAEAIQMLKQIHRRLGDSALIASEQPEGETNERQ